MRNAPWRALPYLAGFLLPPHVVRCISAGGWSTFLPVITVFVVVPLVDALGGMSDEARPPSKVETNVWFRIVTWAWVPMQLGLLAWVLRMATSGRLSGLEIAGATVSMGATSGALGITFAHELVHRRGRFERGLGEILLASVSYTHFAIEHVHGHHRHVGTPADPATARFGESFYRFLPRTLAGSLISAWHLEVERLGRRGRTACSPANRMLRYGLTQVLLWAGLLTILGATGVAVFAGQAIIAISLLEVINYIEHYGLTRREIAPGEYERIAPQHSWDSSYRISNWMLINLARHSDHHCMASKRYQSLELPAPAPQLPAGYGAMFLLALVPPLWFRVMNPRVAAATRVSHSVR
jgi:alkane 1-monooxygenase